MQIYDKGRPVGIENKIEAFNYFVYLLIKWYLGINLDDELTQEQLELFNKLNDFSILKLIRILFISCAESYNREELYNIFNKFYANEFGTSESDLIRYLKATPSVMKIVRNKIVANEKILEYNETSNDIIDKMINNVLLKNRLLPYKTGMELIEINQKYNSWKKSYNFASWFQKLTFKIPKQYLIEDNYLWA